MNPVAFTTLLTATLAFSSFARADNSIKWIPSTTNKQILYDQNNVIRYNKYKDIFLVHFYNSIRKEGFYAAISCTNSIVVGLNANGTIGSPAQRITPNSVANEVHGKYCPSSNNAVSNYANEMNKQIILDMYRRSLRTTAGVSEFIK